MINELRSIKNFSPNSNFPIWGKRNIFYQEKYSKNGKNGIIF